MIGGMIGAMRMVIGRAGEGGVETVETGDA